MHLPRNTAAKICRTPLSISIILIIIGVFLCALLFSFTRSLAAPNARQIPFARKQSAASDARHEVAGAYGKLPLSFAANLGQADSRARFIASGGSYRLFLTANEAVLGLKPATHAASKENADGRDSADVGQILRLRLSGANRQAMIEALDELPGKLNYFIGKNPSQWRTNIPTYSQVKYRNAYPGIDVLYHGNQQQLEYDFLIAPGSSPRRIKLTFAGARDISIAANGDLVLQTAAGDVRQHKPIAYQEFKGERQEVAVDYKLKGNQVTFQTGAYDKRLPLIIDPVIVYSSFLGGTNSEQGLGIAVDAQGSAYLTGSTFSNDFPVVGAFQGSQNSFPSDAFVVKVNPSGTSLVYATYLGGSSSEVGNAIAVDAQGSAYVVGNSFSDNFPITGGSFQDARDGSGDAFVTKLSPDGSTLSYSTFLGGRNLESAYGLALDTGGRVYVVGSTQSTRFRTVTFPTPRNGNPAYKSTDRGGNWSPVGSGLTGTAVNALAFDPSDSNTIYAGAVFGVFKTLDAGAHWNLTAPGNTAITTQTINAVAVDPTNSSVVYAGGTLGLYKSDDGGATYSQKTNGIASFTVRSLAIDPITPTTLYAGMQTNILYKSTNGGENWTQMRNGISGGPRVNKVVIDPTNTAIVYAATSSGLYKTTNGAISWTAVNSGISSAPNMTTLAIDPTHTDTLYAGANIPLQPVYKTTDGGASWSAIAIGLPFSAPKALAVDPVTPTTLYAATTNYGIFKSTDGGANWIQSKTNLSNLVTNEVIVDRNNPATVYAGTSTGSDVFAVRLNSSGSALDYLLNFGGSENDEAHGVALGSDNSAYIVGLTSSQNFPVLNAFQSVNGGFQDAFVTKLNPSGSAIVYSTYLGGDAFDAGRAVAVRADSAYVTGDTTSQNFPVVNPIQPGPFNFDADAFVTKLNPTGSSLDFSSCFGGTSSEQGYGLDLDPSGNIYLTGSTFSSDFPLVAAVQSSPGGVYVSKINAAGSAFVYSTYLGASNGDQGNGIAVDVLGNAYIIGTTSSFIFPTVGGFQSTLKGNSDAFVAKIGVQADVSILKKDSRDPVMVNNPFTYTLSVNNAGPSVATAVTVTDVLPAGLTFLAATPTQGSCSFSSGTVTCNLGTLPASAGAIIQIAVTPTTVATISNTATVVALEADNASANNSATELTKISSMPSIKGHVAGANAIGVGGVLMTLSGGQSATTQTDVNGFYQFAELPVGGNYTLTPTKSNLSFEPPAQTLNNLNTDQTADFVASTCTYSLSPATASFGSNGGTGVVSVNSLNGCPWNAVSSANWLTITAGSQGVGSGSVSYSVGATTAPRVGHLTIAGKNFPVYQEVNSCAAPTFSVATYNFSGSPNIARTADLNGDGYYDILLATNGLSGAGIQASVMLNDGTGAFASSSFDTGLGTPQGYILADFNNDGRPDVAGTSYNTPFVRILFNGGSGGFGQSSVNIPFDSQGQSPLTGPVFSSDLNHDGNADLLVSTYNNKTQILLGNGSAGFTQIAPVLMPTFSLTDIADLNKDGNPDLLLAGGSSSTPLGVMLGNGSGGFGALITSTGIDYASNIHTLGDFDGDGLTDIVQATSISASSFTGLVMMSGDGLGHFVKKAMYSLSNSGSMTTGDFNGDGKADVAFSAESTKVIVLLGDGIGGFASSILTDTAGQSQFPGNGGLVAADFNGDLRPDLAVANYTLGAHVLRNNCAAAPAISGRITDSRNTRGLEGVGITLGPLQVIRTYTDSSGNYFIGNLTAGGNYQVIPSKSNFKFTPASTNINNLSGTQTANFVGTPTTVQFTQIHYLVEENTASVQINVSRSGDLSGVTTVDYTTVDGTASARSDYTAAVGTLNFAPGDAVKSFNVLLTDDALIEGYESLRLVLSNASGALLATPQTDSLPSDVLMEIHDNDFNSGAPNPIGNSQFFVRQHYHDFLNREPDAGGLQFWVDQIESCGSDQACREVKRINVSAAFFLSIEFQETGYLAYRMYNAAYGDTTSPNVAGTVPIIRLQEFQPDSQQIGQGVQVGIGNWQQQLEDNKTAYASAFVQRQRFLAAFPLNLTAQQFVNKLDQNTPGVLSADEKSQLIAMLIPTPADAQKRALVLRTVAEDSDLRQRELNRAFVLMQFYGYLRRNPDDPQDTDFRGWKFWLDKLNQFNGNFVQAEMVKSFLVAGEYRQRFGTQ